MFEFVINSLGVWLACPFDPNGNNICKFLLFLVIIKNKRDTQRISAFHENLLRQIFEWFLLKGRDNHTSTLHPSNRKKSNIEFRRGAQN